MQQRNHINALKIHKGFCYGEHIIMHIFSHAWDIKVKSNYVCLNC